AAARAVLHVVHLSHHVGRRATGDSRNGTKPLEIRSMAEGALPACRHRFALLDASFRYVRDKSGPWVAQRLGRLAVLRRLDDPLGARLFARARALDVRD